jgi:quercetin dioxygenase-like cupin family protein
MFEVQPEGKTPSHKHNFEHEIYILEGAGLLVTEKGTQEFQKGSAILIPPMEEHHLENSGPELLRLLCLVPRENE